MTKINNNFSKTKRDITLRIGTLVGIFCRCEDESPVSDVWSRRQRRRLGQAVETRSIIQTTTTRKSEEETKRHLVDGNDDELVIHRDLLMLPGAGRRLTVGSALQQRYIDAIHKGFQRGPLSGVVEVKQIECEDFLTEEEALAYINGLD
mmetsp:Transcript_4002/g.5990  ORF Transcript_4002/g.5990 Transcript_4002/m.5990 type:complete len:149 (+) Transcript_4002:1009-1455(+)